VAAGRLWRSTDGACVFPKPGSTIKVRWRVSASLGLAQMMEGCWVAKANLTSEGTMWYTAAFTYLPRTEGKAAIARRAMVVGAIISSFYLAGLGFAGWAGRSFPASLAMRIVQHAYLCSLSIMTQCRSAASPAPFRTRARLGIPGAKRVRGRTQHCKLPSLALQRQLGVIGYRCICSRALRQVAETSFFLPCFSR
jgi:hypothetical protein